MNHSNFKFLVMGCLFAMLVPACQMNNKNEDSTPHAQRIIHANVVAFEQPLYYNRFGSVNPYGMIYALKRDTTPVQKDEEWLPGLSCPSKIRLRTGKRPRPLTLRGNVGDILEIKFTNQLLKDQPDISQCKLLDDQSPYAHLINASDQIEDIDPEENGTHPDQEKNLPPGDWPKTRSANIVIPGLTSLSSANPKCNGLQAIDPGKSVTCQWKLEQEGTHLFSSHGAPAGGEGDGGSLTHGLFGVVIVEPKDSQWYRSQVTASTLDKVWPRKHENDIARKGKLAYDALDPEDTPYLNMLKSVGKDNHNRMRYELIYGDLNAVILEDDPENPEAPAFREFTVVFHDELKTFYAKNFQELASSRQLSGVGDGFAINYGASGMGSILLANRKEIGPAAECAECFYEEFFLQSWANGDPALLEHFEDDPSNVAHSYLNDRVKFRNLHAGPKETHVFHLHAHQWLSATDTNAGTYLDSQTIAPQQGFDYSIYDGGLSNWGNEASFQTNGSGNRNRTAGDSIFHCHLYPHFAQGMWALWRVHDVIEDGSRKLPDGQPKVRFYGNPQVALSVERLGISGKRAGTDPITGVTDAGTPVPAVLPLPGQSLPPLPTYAQDLSGEAPEAYAMPGYPFYIPGKPGRRAPQPPLDFAKDKDGKPMHGGLPRHVVNSGVRRPAFLSDDLQDRLPDDPETRMSALLRQSLALGDFRLELTQAEITLLDYEGEPIERQAMDFHAGKATKIRLADGSYVSYNSDQSGYPSLTPEGKTAHFFVNGALPAQGAPYADPCHDPAQIGHREYEVSAIGIDMVVNRAGWHDPQARINVLTRDAENIEGQRWHDMEPFFFRAASGECIEFKHQNRTEKELELDDFQVATPTDTIGQHIHLVKFDVTASDGAGNGFNYEDGTFSRGAVAERIAATKGFAVTSEGEQKHLVVGKDLDGNPIGEYQTTVQRWFADPLLTVKSNDENSLGHGMHGGDRSDNTCPADPSQECIDRTLRTVFTHDHFSPSSIQQHGFYSALLVEPAGSEWRQPNGETLSDGVGAKAIIVKADDWLNHENHREYALAVADFALLYEPTLYEPWLDPPANGMARLLHESTDKTGGPVMAVLFGSLEQHAKDWWKQNGKPIDPPFKPEAISKDHHNPYLVNYRHEPIPLRIGKMEKKLQAPEETNCGEFAQDRDANGYFMKRKSIDRQKSGKDGDMSFVFATREHGDPCTPILEAYEGEKVQIRMVQGAQEVQHMFAVEGLYWPRFIDYTIDKNFSREEQAKQDNPLALVAAQEIGISEHFEMKLPAFQNVGSGATVNDYLYHFGTIDALWNGVWGLLRVHNGIHSPDPQACGPNQDDVTDNASKKWFARRNLFIEGEEGTPPECQTSIQARLKPLPGHGSSKIVVTDTTQPRYSRQDNNFPRECPAGSRPVKYSVVATRFDLLISSQTDRLYYDRENQIFDPDALLLLAMPPDSSTLELADVRHEYRLAIEKGTLEPLVLRANANDCIMLTLHNLLLREGETALPDSRGDALMPKIVPLNVDTSADPDADDIKASTRLSISIPMLATLEPAHNRNLGVGMNRSAEPILSGQQLDLYFYAGRLDLEPEQKIKGVPVCDGDEECPYNSHTIPYAFGTLPIKAFGDVIGHGTHGLFGTLIIEPEGATYHDPVTGSVVSQEDHWKLGTEAVIKYTDENDQKRMFREFVVAYQDGLNLHWEPSLDTVKTTGPIGNCPVCDDSYDRGEKGLNYRSAPFWARLHQEVTLKDDTVKQKTVPGSNLNQFLFPNNFFQETFAPVPTPIFEAKAGEEVRFRVSQPHGRARQRAFLSFGHNYPDLLPQFGSPHAALISPGKGLTATLSGKAKAGCYLYRDGPMQIFAGGVWGHFRVMPSDGTTLQCAES